ncbi:MAG TPA: ribonuclease domain-containing protein [Dissulfurispiraceae bacterium]|nr:ribonuclease domain-containing protein [Dissulfurispiraceae bacterium]
MKRLSVLYTAIAACLMVVFLSPALLHAASCESIARQVSKQLPVPVNETELAEILNSLNATGNRDLPPKFITKKQARDAGWKPGKDLWSVRELRGKSIGGDAFGNFEKKLPRGKWREADLDYRGGKRGAKRIVFSKDGKRMVTVDHYATFTEVPPCK